MSKKCYVFPGQGCQYVGMGKELCESNARARAVFDEIDAALGIKLSEIIFNGPDDELNRPKNVQPAIFAVSMAMWHAENLGAAEFVAGHSLGEYSALCTGKAISIADGARLLHRRGALMESATPLGSGAMGVLIGNMDVPAICAAAANDGGGVCEVANDNGGGQTVISGNKTAVERALELAKDQGAKIAKLLAVPIPAHSSLMAPIVEEFRTALDTAQWQNPAAKFISNKTAAIMTDADEIKEGLVFQLTHGVRWRECVLAMKPFGISEAIEVGPGNVLTNLAKRIAPEINSYRL